MTNTITRNVAVACTAFVAMFAVFNVEAAGPVEKLWFTDSHVTAFYAIDDANHRVIIVTGPGPQGQGHATRTERQLVDGERFAISLDGQGRNALTATLAVTRSGNDLDVRITATPRERSVTAGN